MPTVRRMGIGVTAPVDRLEQFLTQIAAVDSVTGSFIEIDAAGARMDAAASSARWRTNTQLSPIDGVILAVKANIAVLGWPWHAGIHAYRDRIADRDATCIARLRAAGAVLIGLTNMDEAALGAEANNPWFGPTRNPRAPQTSAGGSSGGSAAAVAADFCDAALGTDTMGSVRIPAAYCGVVGHKPQRGSISTEGIVPLSPTLDTVGIVGGDTGICRLLSAVMADGIADPSPPHQPRRVAVADWMTLAAVEPSLATAFERVIDAARRAGLVIVPVPLPDLRAMQRNLLVIAEIEGARVHRRALADNPDGFSAALTQMLSWGARQPAARFERALTNLAANTAAITQAMMGCDALIYPATPHTAFTASAPVPDDQAVFSAIAATTGWPATCFPVGNGARLPIAAEVMTRDAATGFELADLLAGSAS